MNPTLKGYLTLCRPPNLPTAAADILAGLALGGFFNAQNNVWDGALLVFASILLYAGGVVLNDVFDYELDKKERPERPIPSGIITLGKAKVFGFSLLIIGISFASLVTLHSFIIAIVLAMAILLYDTLAKKNVFLGPLNMGTCRGLNLLLGMSCCGHFENWMYCLIPLLFIYAVTMISRGEVHGDNKKNILFAGFLYTTVIFFIWVLHQKESAPVINYLVFLVLFGIMAIFPLIKAFQFNEPKNIMKAVKAGVLSIVLLDAAIAAAHANILLVVCIVLLLPLSIMLARLFAVT